MTFALVARLVEQVGQTPAGSTTRVAVDGPEAIDVVQRWCTSTGNTVLVVHGDAVEVYRGRVADPIGALPPDRQPGHRLWIYTNFHCNLACDYCCVESSPRAERRTIDTPTFAAIVDEAVAAGVAELYVTGGEPFLLTDLDDRLCHAAARLPTTVLTNAMVWQGERRRRLERLPRRGIVLQVSLDSAEPELHDRHRGAGSHARALEGIRVALDAGFRVRIAATVSGVDHQAEVAFDELCGRLGVPPEDRVVRRIARQGAANAGLVLSRASLLPEVCVTAEGVWWHPVAAIDPAMRVADDWRPLRHHIDTIADELRRHRLAGDVLASSFPCA